MADFETTGIIPTRVGTRKMTKKEDWEAKDHPHACGDKSPANCTFTYDVGSSPRVWGQVTAVGTASEFTRIIPTRVGTSFVKSV